MKRLLAIILLSLTTIGIFTTVDVHAASKKVKLSKKKVELSIYQEYTLKLKNAKNDVSWTVVENADYIKIQPNGNTCTIQPLCTGKQFTITAKYKNKTYKCKITCNDSISFTTMAALVNAEVLRQAYQKNTITPYWIDLSIFDPKFIKIKTNYLLEDGTPDYNTFPNIAKYDYYSKKQIKNCAVQLTTDEDIEKMIAAQYTEKILDYKIYVDNYNVQFLGNVDYNDKTDTSIVEVSNSAFGVIQAQIKGKVDIEPGQAIKLYFIPLAAFNSATKGITTDILNALAYYIEVDKSVKYKLTPEESTLYRDISNEYHLSKVEFNSLFKNNTITEIYDLINKYKENNVELTKEMLLTDGVLNNTVVIVPIFVITDNYSKGYYGSKIVTYNGTVKPGLKFTGPASFSYDTNGLVTTVLAKFKNGLLDGKGNTIQNEYGISQEFEYTNGTFVEQTMKDKGTTLYKLVCKDNILFKIDSKGRSSSLVYNIQQLQTCGHMDAIDILYNNVLYNCSDTINYEAINYYTTKNDIGSLLSYIDNDKDFQDFCLIVYANFPPYITSSKAIDRSINIKTKIDNTVWYSEYLKNVECLDGAFLDISWKESDSILTINLSQTQEYNGNVHHTGRYTIVKNNESLYFLLNLAYTSDLFNYQGICWSAGDNYATNVRILTNNKTIETDYGTAIIGIVLDCENIDLTKF